MPYNESTQVKTSCMVVDEHDDGSDNNFQVGKYKKLLNSNVINDLPNKLSHLTSLQVGEISQLLTDYKDLFNDVPKPCTALHHDVQLIEAARPIKQCAYRMSPEKSRLMKD